MQIIKFVIYSVSILIAGYFLPGIIVEDFGTSMVAALVLAIVTGLLKPFLMVLTLPINILTLGLFTFVINAGLVLLADFIVPGFEVDGIIWAVIFGFAVSLINGILNLFVKE
jgi:putative membrane protein